MILVCGKGGMDHEAPRRAHRHRQQLIPVDAGAPGRHRGGPEGPGGELLPLLRLLPPLRRRD